MNKLIFKPFKFSIENKIKEARKVKVQLETEEDKQMNIKIRAPFYKFPTPFINTKLLFVPPFLYNCLNLSQPYFTTEYANAVCIFNDYLLLSYSGVLGAIIGCLFMSNYDKKPIILGIYSLQLVTILGASVLGYNFDPLMIGSLYFGMVAHLGFLKYSFSIQDLPRLYYNYYLKSIPFILLSSMLGMSIIIFTNQYINDMERKIEDMQKLSDSLKEEK